MYAVPQHMPVLRESPMPAGGACYITRVCDMTEIEKAGKKIRLRNNLQTVKQAKQTDKQLR
jgi:hypothetical protein